MQIAVILFASSNIGMVLGDMKDAGLNLGHGKITVESWFVDLSK